MPQPVVHFEVIGKASAKPAEARDAAPIPLGSASTSAHSSVGTSTFRLPCRG